VPTIIIFLFPFLDTKENMQWDSALELGNWEFTCTHSRIINLVYFVKEWTG